MGKWLASLLLSYWSELISDMKENYLNGGLSVPKIFYVGTQLNMGLMQDKENKQINYQIIKIIKKEKEA